MKNIILATVLVTFAFNLLVSSSIAAELGQDKSVDMKSKAKLLCKFTYLSTTEMDKQGKNKDVDEVKLLSEHLAFFYWGLEGLSGIALGMRMGDFADPIYQQYILNKGTKYILKMRALQIILIADSVRQLFCVGSNPKEGAMIALNNLMTTDSVAYASTISDYYKTKLGFQSFLKLPTDTQNFYLNEDEGLKLMFELNQLYKDVH